MQNSRQAPGVVGPFAGLDVPWLLRMRAETRKEHPFLIWAPFDAPARKWSYGEFHDRVGALSANRDSKLSPRAGAFAGAPASCEVTAIQRNPVQFVATSSA